MTYSNACSGNTPSVSDTLHQSDPVLDYSGLMYVSPQCPSIIQTDNALTQTELQASIILVKYIRIGRHLGKVKVKVFKMLCHGITHTVCNYSHLKM